MPQYQGKHLNSKSSLNCIPQSGKQNDNRLIYNLKEIEELKRKAHFLEVINSFSEELLKINTVDETLWSVVKHAISKLGYVDCIVYLKVNNELIQKAAYGPKNPKEFDIKNPALKNKGIK